MRSDVERAPRRALVLTGGAARGVYAAGVLESLLAAESFDIVCGSSVGALNGLPVALGRPDLLKTLWRSIANAHVLRTAEPLTSLLAVRRRPVRGLLRTLSALGRLKELRSMLGFYDQTPMRALLEPYASVEALTRTMIVGATDLTRGGNASFAVFRGDDAAERERAYLRAQPDAHRLTQANVLDALCASSALPGAFAPVTIALEDGTTAQFADGGLANNAPIRQAIDAGADHVTVILLQHSGLQYRDRKVPTLGHLAATVHDIVAEHILELELKFARDVNDQVHRGSAPAGKRFIDLRVIGPSVPLRLASLAFGKQAEIDRVFELGAADGRAAIETARRLDASSPPAALTSGDRHGES